MEAIQSRLRDCSIVALPRPHQAGKTTLARLLAKTLPDMEIHPFDLESPADLVRLTNPELVLSPLCGLVILDKIQRMPELYPVLQVLADRPDVPTRFLTLGSASPALVKGASDSLAGRVPLIHVSGFSLTEIGTGNRRNHIPDLERRGKGSPWNRSFR